MSISGAAERCSTMTQTTARMTAAASRARIRPEVLAQE
jgi:hypothetical protein